MRAEKKYLKPFPVFPVKPAGGNGQEIRCCLLFGVGSRFSPYGENGDNGVRHMEKDISSAVAVGDSATLRTVHSLP